MVAAAVGRTEDNSLAGSIAAVGIGLRSPLHMVDRVGTTGHQAGMRRQQGGMLLDLGLEPGLGSR